MVGLFLIEGYLKNGKSLFTKSRKDREKKGLFDAKQRVLTAQVNLAISDCRTSYEYLTL
jgi:hypothetical protein